VTICSIGVSEPKPGAPAAIVITAEFAASIVDFPPWLVPFLPYAPIVSLDVPTFCSVDPPGLLSVPDVSAFQGVFVGAVGALGLVSLFVANIVNVYLWHQLCQCASVSTPAAPTNPTQPTGLPAINPPGVVTPPTTSPCFTVNVGPQDPGSDTDFGNVDLTGSGATSYVLAIHPTDNLTGSSADLIVTLVETFHGAFGDHSQGLLSQTIPSTGDQTFTAPVTPGAFSAQVQVFTFDASSGYELTTTRLDVYCGGGSPGGVKTACCPPDQNTNQLLLTILQQVNLLQRQTAPFAYVLGPVHSALSGTGSFAVQGTLGLLLDVTVPDRAGRTAGTPVAVFDCGWLNFGTEDGYSERHFITSDTELVTPKLPGIYTTVGYTLLEGVSVTATELLREP
jgi:hypothetical protein